MHLPAGDLITLDGIRLGKKGTHVLNEAARDLRRQFYQLAGHELGYKRFGA
jgi:hypothetical protein